LSAAGPLLVGETKQEIKDKLRELNNPTLSMPPWSGTEKELDAIAEFLITVRPEKP
jgi:hypothetical protein